MNPLPIFLDTDIGGDVDDALALALALVSPEIELRGITTVSGNTTQRALLAREVLRHFAPERAESMRIIAGYSAPLEKNEATSGSRDCGATALSFLAEEILNARSAEERLTVVAIGPLTNIALLLKRYPELVGEFELVLMGGYWEGDKAEWNIKCDPEAAAIIFQSSVSLKMVGLNVTRLCILSDEQTARFAQGTPRAQFLDEQIRIWGRKVALHDPLTILTLFSSCVKFEPKRIEVLLAGEQRAWTPTVEDEPNALVAVEVDSEFAKQLFLERVLS